MNRKLQRWSHSVLLFSFVAGAAVSLLTEADKLDTLGLALLDGDWGLVALRGVVLEHKPGVGGALRRGLGQALRWTMRTETLRGSLGGVRGGGQGQQRGQAWRRRRGTLLIRRRGQWGRDAPMEGVTGLMMGSSTRQR